MEELIPVAEQSWTELDRAGQNWANVACGKLALVANPPARQERLVAFCLRS